MDSKLTMRKLTIDAPGATAEELASALAAAQALLDAHGVTPEEAGVGHHLREAWSIGGRQVTDSPSDAELKAARLWDDARAAAALACCSGALHPPGSVAIGLEDEPEPPAPG